MQSEDDQWKREGGTDAFSGDGTPDFGTASLDFVSGEASGAEDANMPGAPDANETGMQTLFQEEPDAQEELALEDPPEEDFHSGNVEDDSVSVDAPETDLDGMPLEEAMVEPVPETVSVPEKSSVSEDPQSEDLSADDAESAQDKSRSATVPEQDSAPLFDALSLSADGTAVSEPLPPVAKIEPQISDALVVPVGSLGESLRKYREAAGYSLEDFAIRNKVLPPILESLEAGSYRDVNDIFFLRRQLQRMFRDLDLNEDIQEQLLVQMEKEYHLAREANTSRRSSRLETPTGDPYFSENVPTGRRPLQGIFSRLPGIVMMVVILIVLLIGVMYFLHPLLEKHRNRNQNDVPLDLAPLVMPPVPQKQILAVPFSGNSPEKSGAARETQRRP